MHKQWSNFQIEDRHERAWRNGRAHLALATGKERDDGKNGLSAIFGFEWVHFHKTLRDLGFKISTTGEETLDIHYGLGSLGQHWWSLELRREGRFIQLPRIRFDVSLGLTQIRWCFGPDDGGWSRDASWKERLRRNDLKWWRVYRYRRSTKDVETVPETVRLPEGEIPVEITLSREIWGWVVGPYKLTRTSKRRLRFWLPFGRRIEHSVELKAAPGGLTFPGKGENSWDIGQDFFTSISCGYRGHVDERREWIAFALSTALKEVMRSRLRYGRSTADTGA